jgi:hypothetical protein
LERAPPATGGQPKGSGGGGENGNPQRGAAMGDKRHGSPIASAPMNAK